MSCKPFNSGGVFQGFICGPKPRAKKCHYCAAPSTVLCDHPSGIGKTCDRPCCKTHSEHVGADRDYCLTHAEFERKKKAEATVKADALEQAGMHKCWGCEEPVAVKGDLCEWCQDARSDAWDQEHPEERCPPKR